MSPKALVSFRKEVFVMNSLRHPNVVLMMGACQTPPQLAILMEFVPGGSLYKVWRWLSGIDRRTVLQVVYLHLHISVFM